MSSSRLRQVLTVQEVLLLALLKQTYLRWDHTLLENKSICVRTAASCTAMSCAARPFCARCPPENTTAVYAQHREQHAVNQVLKGGFSRILCLRPFPHTTSIAPFPPTTITGTHTHTGRRSPHDPFTIPQTPQRSYVRPKLIPMLLQHPTASQPTQCRKTYNKNHKTEKINEIPPAHPS